MEPVNTISDAEFDEIMGDFDDDMDAAFLDDEEMMNALNYVNSHSEDPDLIEAVDPRIDYTNEMHLPDFVDVAADDYIAEVRDLFYNPFEEEIVEIALNTLD